MIILDTNVISEIMKPNPSLNVTTWIDNQDASGLFISTITIAEICYGLNALPEGNRRDILETAFNKTITEAFEYNILSFDEACAHVYGKIMANRKKIGRPMGILDGQIAATACAHGFSVATRNVSDFSDCGVDLINPF